jgi:hypothetical protein
MAEVVTKGNADFRKFPMMQSDASWQRALVELRARAEKGVKLEYEDSEDIGNKYTTCNLGLCDRAIDKAMDGINCRGTHVCPNDGRFFGRGGKQIAPINNAADGCFFKCHVFQNVKNSRARTHERVLAACATLISADAP